MEENQNTQVNDTQENTENKGGEQSTNIDYAKLEEMINKGLQVKENGILKSYFSQCGLSEEEAKEAIETYKTNKESKAKEAEKSALKNSPELAELKQQIETLKSEARKEKLNNAIQKTAFGMGLSEKAITAMLKIQTFDVEGDTINEDKIKEGIQAFLDEYDVFKPNTKQGFKVSVGADSEPIKKETEEDAMRKAIGLIGKK